MNGNNQDQSKSFKDFNRTLISKGTTVLIVTLALLLDNMLLTVIFPIIPQFLSDIRNEGIQVNSTNETDNNSIKHNNVKAIYTNFHLQNLQDINMLKKFDNGTDLQKDIY